MKDSSQHTPKDNSSQSDPGKLCYSKREVASMTSLSERTIERLIKCGKISCVKMQRRVLIPAQSLRQFIATGAGVSDG